MSTADITAVLWRGVSEGRPRIATSRDGRAPAVIRISRLVEGVGTKDNHLQFTIIHNDDEQTVADLEIFARGAIWLAAAVYVFGEYR